MLAVALAAMASVERSRLPIRRPASSRAALRVTSPEPVVVGGRYELGEPLGQRAFFVDFIAQNNRYIGPLLAVMQAIPGDE